MRNRPAAPRLILLAALLTGCTSLSRPPVGHLQVRPISQTDLARIKAIAAESEAAAAEMRDRLTAASP